MSQTTIKYLNDSQRSLEYVNKDGNTIILNPFDSNYGAVAERLANIIRSGADNMRNRKNYEDAVANAQENIVDGRPYDPLPNPPECEFWPDDSSLPGTTIKWNPPLATTHSITVNRSGEGATQDPGTAKLDDATTKMIANIMKLLLDHPEYGALVKQLASVS